MYLLNKSLSSSLITYYTLTSHKKLVLIPHLNSLNNNIRLQTFHLYPNYNNPLLDEGIPRVVSIIRFARYYLSVPWTYTVYLRLIYLHVTIYWLCVYVALGTLLTNLKPMEIFQRNIF